MRRLSSSEVELVRHLVTGSEPPPPDAAIDWDRVLACAGYHRLLPLLHEASKASPFEIPTSVETRLQKAQHVELARTVVRLNHVEALERRASRSGRALALLKGAAFVDSLYPNPVTRPMADIDVLARAKEWQAWAADLESIGFEPHDDSDHAMCFRHRHTGVFLELHRSITSCNTYLGVDTDELFERSLPAGRLRTLSPEDHLAHLCLHASFQHGFRQAAINACDARRLVARPGFDRSRFLDHASEPRLAPWIYGGLRLSDTVFPSEALRALAEACRGSVSHRTVKKLDELDAASCLMPDPRGTSGAPFRRLWAADDIPSTISLLKEVLRPRGDAAESGVFSWVARASQLLWNHCIKVIPLALMKHAHAFHRPTPASLGEVRDV